ncbi:hypothetical protein ACOME3_008773 [Neoechinorhynchus agilis]
MSVYDTAYMDLWELKKDPSESSVEEGSCVREELKSLDEAIKSKVKSTEKTSMPQSVTHKDAGHIVNKEMVTPNRFRIRVEPYIECRDIGTTPSHVSTSLPGPTNLRTRVEAVATQDSGTNP